MGDDYSIVEAARVSYGEGTRKISDDRTLIRYLMRHRHTTPFEMAEIKLRVRVPMDCWRQWIRHRTACLAGDVQVSFDLPGGKSFNSSRPRHYPLTVREIYERWQPTKNRSRPDKQKNPLIKRERLQNMLLRSYNETTGLIYYTHLTDIWENGVKQIIRIEFPGNRILRTTEDHLCLTDKGWLKLKIALAEKTMFLASDRKQRDRSQFSYPVIDISQEEWRPIQNYSKRYEISNMGRVRSFVAAGGSDNIKVLTVPRLKQPTIDHRGYLIVSLSMSSRSIVHSIHQLVAEAFIGPCPANQEVRHENHNSLDCRADNLSYGTLRDNVNDRMTSGCDQTLIPTFFQPISWRLDGEEMTYDLSVAGPHHNFFAGGMVVHNSVNEYSTRYSEAIDSQQKTDPKEWRKQADKNKQGSGEFISETAEDDMPYMSPGKFGCGLNLTADEKSSHNASTALYQRRLKAGVAREQARKDLPLSTYTEAYWKIDLHNLFHFLSLRMDSHAQLEIRKYATVIGQEIVKPLFPLAWEAFEDYRLGAVYLSKIDVEMIQRLSVFDKPVSPSDFMEHQHDSWKNLKRCRERDECFEKLVRLKVINTDTALKGQS